MMLSRFFYLLLRLSLTGLLAVAGMTGCQQNPPNKPHKNAPVDSVRFPDQVHARYAKGFRISYHKNYKLLEILRPFQDQVDTLRFSLVPRALTDQVQVEGTEEIPIPVENLIATSTTHVGLTEMLDATGVITGMVGAEYVYNEQIRRRLRAGKITSFPSGGLNKEEVLSMKPDLVMISGGQSSQFDDYQVLMDSGISVMVNSEWLEKTPLGKAEWVKVMAALLNKERLANRKFQEVANAYHDLKAAVDSVDQKPLVINNMPYKGAWFVSGGNSFTARYLRDAGADYPWFDAEETGGIRKDFEVVYRMGLKADIWINPGAAKTKQDILAKDSRLADFKSFQTGRIYNNNRRVRSSGGNDYWESGVVHPEKILADLIKILHPSVVPNHELYYYQQLQ